MTHGYKVKPLWYFYALSCWFNDIMHRNKESKKPMKCYSVIFQGWWTHFFRFMKIHYAQSKGMPHDHSFLCNRLTCFWLYTYNPPQSRKVLIRFLCSFLLANPHSKLDSERSTLNRPKCFHGRFQIFLVRKNVHYS